jgi:hypothetical protein
MNAGFRWRTWTEAVHSGEAVFLVGAGVSCDTPSHLPLATGVVTHLVGTLVQHLRLRRGLALQAIRRLSQLRPEVLADILVEHLGASALMPLTYLLRGQPNAWHCLLAQALSHGCCVITTNLDTLIEQACADAHGPVTVVTNAAKARELISRRRAFQRILLKLHKIGENRDRHYYRDNSWCLRS